MRCEEEDRSCLLKNAQPFVLGEPPVFWHSVDVKERPMPFLSAMYMTGATCLSIVLNIVLNFVFKAV